MSQFLIRTGVDMLEISRLKNAIERHGRRFSERVFTPQELAECRENYASLAARFAAKEAVSKALGTGFGLIAWRDVEVERGPSREPLLRLHGEAARRAQELGLVTWSLSLSHTQEHAIALVVAVGESPEMHEIEPQEENRVN